MSCSSNKFKSQAWFYAIHAYTSYTDAKHTSSNIVYINNDLYIVPTFLKEDAQMLSKPGYLEHLLHVLCCLNDELKSPLLLSDIFLNEAHYVLIDFSYSFSPVNTPKVLLFHSALLHAAPPGLPLHGTRTIYPSIRCFAGFYQQRQTAEHLRDLNDFQLAKQIPPLTLTLSHSASENLGGHYRPLEFNKPNMLTVLIEREEEEEQKMCPHHPSLPLSHSLGCYIFLIALNP